MNDYNPRPLAELIDPGWARALAPVEERVHELGTMLAKDVEEGHGYLPAGTEYAVCAVEKNGTLMPEMRQRAAYAALGTGLMLAQGIPVLYEGINEKGLMGGQLYYREFAHYEDAPQPGRLAVQPPFVVYHLLAQQLQ